MRMHVEGAAIVQRKVVIGAAARWDRRSRDPGHAVLLPRRRKAVPVDQARLADPVFHTNAKRLADLRRDAKRPVRLLDAVDGSRLAVYLDVAALQLQDRLRRRIAAGPAGRRVLRLRGEPKVGRRGKGAYDGGTPGQHDKVSSKAAF